MPANCANLESHIRGINCMPRFQGVTKRVYLALVSVSKLSPYQVTVQTKTDMNAGHKSYQHFLVLSPGTVGNFLFDTSSEHACVVTAGAACPGCYYAKAVIRQTCFVIAFCMNTHAVGLYYAVVINTNTSRICCMACSN